MTTRNGEFAPKVELFLIMFQVVVSMSIESDGFKLQVDVSMRTRSSKYKSQSELLLFALLMSQ